MARPLVAWQRHPGVVTASVPSLREGLIDVVIHPVPADADWRWLLGTAPARQSWRWSAEVALPGHPGAVYRGLGTRGLCEDHARACVRRVLEEEGYEVS